MNRVEVSDDRMTMVIRGARGERAELHSALPTGFTDDHLWAAQDYTFVAKPGSKHWGWLKQIGGCELYLHAETGPPTWWLPRVDVRRRFMVGWLRLMIAVKIRSRR
jgi:hypothetical protein